MDKLSKREEEGKRTSRLRCGMSKVLMTSGWTMRAPRRPTEKWKG